MKIWGLNANQVRTVVEQVSANRYSGNLIPNRLDDRIGPRSTTTNLTIRGIKSRQPGTRESWSGRASVAGCWHAHRDVMRALFAAGGTRIQSAMADYRGAEDFESKYHSTGNQNIGSMVQPAYMPDLCECEF